MSVLLWVYQHAFCSSVALVCVCIGTLVWLAVGYALALALNQSGYALAFGLSALGVNLTVLFALKITLQNATLYFATLLCVCGIFYGLALTMVTVRTYILIRKEERAKIARATCYTLPARENQFIRERLHTVLQEVADEEENLEISFTYVRRMLLQLRNATLSLTEKLEVEELSKLFALYTKKETFTSEDVNVVNEAFSRLLKLSAKHGVIAR